MASKALSTTVLMLTVLDLWLEDETDIGKSSKIEFGVQGKMTGTTQCSLPLVYDGRSITRALDRPGGRSFLGI
jgi:hypothetical protein